MHKQIRTGRSVIVPKYHRFIRNNAEEREMNDARKKKYIPIPQLTHPPHQL
jgi:glutaredoxin-related protein